MQFVVNAEFTYWWPVKVRTPNPDPRKAGHPVEQQFKAQFRATDRDEAKRIRDEIAALPEDEREDRQNDQLKAVLIGWDEEIVDADKEPIPFEPATLDMVLANPWALRALWEAWLASMVMDGARKGNSAR